MAVPAASITRAFLPKFSWSASATAIESRSASRIANGLHARNHVSPIVAQCRGFASNARYQTGLRIIPVGAKRDVQKASFVSSGQQLDGRRQFSATARQERDHHFDTLKFVQRLQDDGFTEEQAVAMMKVLGDVVEER